jgi:predicted NAD/FAD-binding protein
MKVAIVGSGISGLGAAFALKNHADVTVFEAGARAGGHSCTIEFPSADGTMTPVDIGFIVYNGHNYPNLTGLFKALDVATQASDMSFSLSGPDGFEWASDRKGLFARKANLVRPRFWRFLTEILRFNRLAQAAIAAEDGTVEGFGVWLDRHGFSVDFKENYILPMGAAIWSTPEARILDYPAGSFLRFFDNHRLLHSERPKWRTVTGGSQRYVSALAGLLGERLRVGAPVAWVRRHAGGGLMVGLADGSQERFDQVILTCHSDQSAAMLGEDFADRRFPLRSVHYQPNRVVLHTDARFMPKRRAAWASWNVFKTDDGALTLTYWMNRLQGLDPARNVFVTLNPKQEMAEGAVLHERVFDHPLFDAAAAAAVREVKRHNGEDGLWFAGAWMGYGFHEDGLKSGLSAALSLGGKVDWDAEGVELRVPGAMRPPTERVVREAGSA